MLNRQGMADRVAADEAELAKVLPEPQTVAVEGLLRLRKPVRGQMAQVDQEFPNAFAGHSVTRRREKSGPERRRRFRGRKTPAGHEQRCSPGEIDRRARYERAVTLPHLPIPVHVDAKVSAMLTPNCEKS